jgi:GNAT superfamily N-acetyltransferase
MHPQPDDTAFTWEITEHPGDKTAALRQHLGAFNVERAEIDQSQDLAIFVSSQQGELIAGIVGWIWGECLEIAYLWVHAELRGQGYGTRLMERLEAEARQRGCRISALDTFSFQAPEFYTKLGYEIFGSVAGYPNGVQKFFLRKQLRTTTFATESSEDSHAYST